MLKALSNMAAGGVDLLEAEARLARAHLLRFAALAAVYGVCAIVGVVAVLSIGAGIVVLLAAELGAGPALLAVGCAALALTLGTLMFASSRLHKEPERGTAVPR